MMEASMEYDLTEALTPDFPEKRCYTVEDLQNNDGNFYCPTLIVAPITTKLKKLNMPTHCCFEKVRGLPEPSMVSLEQIKTIDKCRVEKYLGKMTREQMREVEDAIRESLGMEIPECVEAP